MLISRPGCTIGTAAVIGISAVFPDSSVEDLKKKWKNVRDNYTREINESRRLESGSEAPKKTKKTYAYAEILNFLQPIVKKRKTTGNLNVIDSSPAGDNDVSDKEDLVNACHTYKSSTAQKKKKICTPFQESLLEAIKNPPLLNKPPEVEDDPDKAFLLSFLPDIKQLEQNQKMELKFQFLQSLKNICTQLNQNAPNNLYSPLNLQPSSQPIMPLHQKHSLYSPMHNHPNISSYISNLPSLVTQQYQKVHNPTSFKHSYPSISNNLFPTNMPYLPSSSTPQQQTVQNPASSDQFFSHNSSLQTISPNISQPQSHTTMQQISNSSPLNINASHQSSYTNDLPATNNSVIFEMSHQPQHLLKECQYQISSDDQSSPNSHVLDQ